MITEHDVRVGGVTLHYGQIGNPEPPIVLLHGLGWDHTVWREAMTRLSVSRRVIALDLPGHGRSDAPRATYSPAWLAGGVRAFLEQIGVARAVLVGNSMGGLVAAQLAAAQPDMIDALVLVAPALPNDHPPPDKRRSMQFVAGTLPFVGPILAGRFFGRDPDVVVAERLANNLVDPRRATEQVVAGMRQDAARRGRSPELLAAGVAASRGILWSMTGRRESTWAMLRSIAVPTAFIWGEQDRTVPLVISERALGSVRGSHLITLDDCGHTPQAEKPDAFCQSLMSFVRAADAARSA